ncbi:MAG: O-antigen ligase family protein [Paraglaciecola sp.]|nr:O-antigen ligase family protein [Paraglaciecola sp.]
MFTPQQSTKLNFSFKHLFFIVALFLPVLANQLFFLVSGILGYSYEGSEESNVFVLYSVFVFLFSLVFYFICSAKNCFSFRDLTFFLFTSLFLICGIFLSFISEFEFEFKELVYFLVLGLPGAFSGLLFYRLISTTSFKYFRAFILVTSYLFIFSVSQVFLSAEAFADLVLGGAGYQFISYTASLLFGIVLYILYCQVLSVSVIGSSNSKLVIIPLLILLPAIVFLTGSKGAALLFLIYSLLFLAILIIKSSKKFHFFIFTAGALAFFMIVNFSNFELDIMGLNRILMVFDSDATLDSRTSGRVEYYDNFFFLIQSSPIYGHGPFVNNGYVTNSHNYFSMILLNFGLVLGLSFLLFNFYLLFSSVKRFRFSDFSIGLPLIFFLYLLVNLSFSGSYLKNPIYWFVFSIMFCMVRVKRFA